MKEEYSSYYLIFFFFLGNTVPKKKTPGTLKAFSDYRKQTGMDIPLVMLDYEKEDLQKIANDNEISIASYYKPSSELGGDFCDVMDLGNGKIGIYLWDFAGHGIGAAINTFRLHTVIKDLKKTLLDPGKFLTFMNKKLYELLDHSQYATMFYGVLDTKKNRQSVGYIDIG